MPNSSGLSGPLAQGLSMPMHLIGCGAFTSGVSYEAEATALFARFSTDPGTTRKNAINTCIASLKTAGVWSKLDGLWVFAAHEQASALLNWKGASYPVTMTSALSFTVDQGLTCDGTLGDAGTTGMTLGSLSNFSQNSAHISAWMRSSGGNLACLGIAGGTAGLNLYPRYIDDNFYGRLNDAVELAGVAAPGTTAAGHSLANRSGANDRQNYRDGTSIQTSTSNASTDLSARDFVLFPNFAQGQISAATIGGSLNGTEVTALYNALNTLKTAIGW